MDNLINGELTELGGPARGGSHVTRLNFKTSHVGVYKCLSLLLSALPSLSQFGRGRLSLVTISFLALSLLFGPCRLLWIGGWLWELVAQERWSCIEV